jgi:hypothetical protein
VASDPRLAIEKNSTQMTQMKTAMPQMNEQRVHLRQCCLNLRDLR